ncbi:DUF5723 family protein [candidate division KSB1 bacterium]
MTAKTYTIQGLSIIIFSLLILSKTTQSQTDRTKYFLESIPQANYSNPANVPDAKYYIAIPGLSSHYLSFKNSGFTYEDILSRRDDDSLELTTNKFLNSLSEKNTLSFNQSAEILAFGFRARKSYFYFNITEKFSSNMKYPKELFNLLLNGNYQYIGEEVSLEGIGLNLNVYNEFALGFSREINKRWTIGTRIKYLIGIANIWTEESDLKLYTGTADEAYTMRATSNIIINTAVPGTLSKISDSIGEFEFSDFTKNSGFALDLGGKFKLNEKFTFSASVIDFGYIKWKEGVENYVSKSANNTFSFEGIEFNEFFSGGEVNDSTFTTVIDSLEKSLGIDTTNNSYRAPLVTQFHVAAIYSLTPRDRFGALIRGNISSTGLDPSITVSYNRAFGRTFNLAISYTAMNKSYMNFGLGTVLNIGAFQLYLISDNIYSYIAPKKSKFVNFVFGMNVTVGRIKPPKIFALEVDDTPMEAPLETTPTETPVEEEQKVEQEKEQEDIQDDEQD